MKRLWQLPTSQQCTTEIYANRYIRETVLNILANDLLSSTIPLWFMYEQRNLGLEWTGNCNISHSIALFRTDSFIHCMHRCPFCGAWQRPQSTGGRLSLWRTGAESIFSALTLLKIWALVYLLCLGSRQGCWEIWPLVRLSCSKGDPGLQGALWPSPPAWHGDRPGLKNSGPRVHFPDC